MNELTRNCCYFMIIILCIKNIELISGDNSFYCQSDLPKPESSLNGYKLELVQTVIRHGDRTQLRSKGVFDQPAATWNCELNSLNKPSMGRSNQDATKRLFRTIFKDGREFLPGNCNLGQLTDKGYNQHISLGKKLREVYQPFGIFQNGTNILSVRSTNVYRTLQSGMAEITGMFPEETASNGVEVIEIETRDGEVEDMVPDKICPAYKPALDKFHGSQYWNDYHNSFKVQTLVNYLKTSFKSNILPTWDEMFDMYNSRKCHGFGVPVPITDEVAQQIFDIATWEVNATASEPSLVKIGMGSFVKTLRDNLQNYITNKSARNIKYRLFSGHDSTVAPLLAALGIYDGFWPPYASHIEFELWSRSNQFFVQIKYNGKTLYLPKCNSSLCPFSTLYKWFTSVIPTDAECHGTFE